eukprot:COSAG05_NODE_953_length_6443_cov_14.987390_3_plen_157_part_00
MKERQQKRPVNWPPMTKNPPWKTKHVSIAYDRDNSSVVPEIAEVELDNEHGQQTLKWPLSWVEVGEVSEFLPDAGTAIKYGKSQLAVYNFASRGEWYAAQNMCPHKRTIALSRGLIGDKAGEPRNHLLTSHISPRLLAVLAHVYVCVCVCGHARRA